MLKNIFSLRGRIWRLGFSVGSLGMFLFGVVMFVLGMTLKEPLVSQIGLIISIYAFIVAPIGWFQDLSWVGTNVLGLLIPHHSLFYSYELFFSKRTEATNKYGVNLIAKEVLV